MDVSTTDLTFLNNGFYWNEGYEWGECDFDYNDIGDVLPVSFGIVIGESK